MTEITRWYMNIVLDYHDLPKDELAMLADRQQGDGARDHDYLYGIWNSIHTDLPQDGLYCVHSNRYTPKDHPPYLQIVIESDAPRSAVMDQAAKLVWDTVDDFTPIKIEQRLHVQDRGPHYTFHYDRGWYEDYYWKPKLEEMKKMDNKKELGEVVGLKLLFLGNATDSEKAALVKVIENLPFVLEIEDIHHKEEDEPELFTLEEYAERLFNAGTMFNNWTVSELLDKKTPIEMGKKLANLYRRVRKEEPWKKMVEINGKDIEVNAYTEDDHDLIIKCMLDVAFD